MASGAPAAQRKLPLEIEQRLREQQAREQADRQLAALLQQTLTNPSETRRFNLCLPAVAHEGEQAVIVVALPTGERLEIPLSEKGKQRIVDGLTEGPDRPANGAVVLG